MTTFGEVSYNDDVYGGGEKKFNKETNKDLFLRLTEGSNEIRLVTSPFQYLVHKVKKDPNNPKDFGQKVKCSKIHGECSICDEGDKAKPRWFYGVIDRKTGTYKVLDVSYQVFSDIRKLARNTQRWGDPTKYDIDVVVDKNGGASGYYSVQPISKEPLSAADQVLKDTADLDDLKRRCTPLEPAQVTKIVNKIRGIADGTVAPAVATGKAPVKAAVKAAPAKTPAVSMTDDEELEETFPDHDSQ